MCFLFKKSGAERPSPSDIVSPDMIVVNDSKVQVNMVTSIPFTKPPKVWIAGIADTNSMDGLFDIGHNCILVSGEDEDEKKIMRDWLKKQSVGNIVVYNDPYARLVIHRIIKKVDKNGETIYTLKGDNNTSNDPYEIRGENIEWVCVGIIY